MSRRNPVLGATAAVGLLALVSATGVLAQQSKPQQKCVNLMNSDGALLAKTQGNENYGCLKAKGKGTLLGSAQTCLTADAKGKVLKRKNKTLAHETKYCLIVPSFGYTSGASVNATAVQRKLDLTADVFGANLDAAVISCATSKPGCICQQKVLYRVEKLAGTKFTEFVKCKKASLKAGATSAAQLVACVSDAGTVGSIAADSKGKIQKRIDRLNADIIDRCDVPNITGAFPGGCPSLSGAALGACLDARVECRVCQTINAMDGIFVDCDLFDDGTANMSCATSPTPTPTATVLPTATPTLPPGTFQGALLKTFGRFTYAAMIGVPGANTQCNTSFPGTHACSFNELLAAEGSGQLAGITDVGSNTVTSFWVIDSTHSNLVQCGVSIHWDYQTAHTGHSGQISNLNNGTGDLGPVITALNCLNQHWVGCCQ